MITLKYSESFLISRLVKSGLFISDLDVLFPLCSYVGKQYTFKFVEVR